mmetsp:Transcript_46251/g.82619  ORF Transcript_46251/g.82619 Transcript_46251/m.82619 type:complete len:275 (-) Transcript_46251:350-1174(-)
MISAVGAILAVVCPLGLPLWLRLAFHVRSEGQMVDDMAHVDGFGMEVVSRGRGDKEDRARDAADLDVTVDDATNRGVLGVGSLLALRRGRGGFGPFKLWGAGPARRGLLLDGIPNGNDEFGHRGGCPGTPVFFMHVDLGIHVVGSITVDTERGEHLNVLRSAKRKVGLVHAIYCSHDDLRATPCLLLYLLGSLFIDRGHGHTERAPRRVKVYDGHPMIVDGVLECGIPDIHYLIALDGDLCLHLFVGIWGFRFLLGDLRLWFRLLMGLLVLPHS